MTDYEIIKALECCGYGIKEKCKECPLINHGEACMYKLKREAHNLIIRKKAEIEKFRRQEIVLPARACGKTALIKKSINDIRAEAIREFAEKLKTKMIVAQLDGILYKVITEGGIDYCVGEMEGEDNGTA